MPHDTKIIIRCADGTCYCVFASELSVLGGGIPVEIEKLHHVAVSDAIHQVALLGDSITESPFARNQAEEADDPFVVVLHRPHDRVLILVRWALYPVVAQ